EAVFLGTRVIVLTAGPARMADNFRVELPHPRTLEMKTNEAFGGYTRRIYRLFGLGEWEVGVVGPAYGFAVGSPKAETHIPEPVVMGPRLRGDDSCTGWSTGFRIMDRWEYWMPAFAGMTKAWSRHKRQD